MAGDATTYLMYHELERDGCPLCHSEEGYARYVVHENIFRQQISWLRNAGIQGLSVTEAFASDSARGVVLTFDDGCETDLLIAAPLLKEASFSATFYITLMFLGQPGYMVPQQVRRLSDEGFEVGCHSMTHPYLDDLSSSELLREVADAKMKLEDIIGRPVHHFSCPGGRWSPAVANTARKAGYQTVSTSRIGRNCRNSDRFKLARISVMRETMLAQYQDWCNDKSLWQLQLRTAIRSTAKELLGNIFYDRIRGMLLENRSKASDSSAPKL